MRILHVPAIAVALCAGAAMAQPAAFQPTRPVTLIVPYSPGSGTDVVGRLYARNLGELWKQPVVVENKPGAGGVIGASTVAKAAPDGQTLMLAVPSLTLNPYIVAKLPYDTRTDFTPVTPLANQVVVLVASPSLNVTDIRSLLETARKNPGGITFASTEPVTRMLGERLAVAGGVKLLNVPYKGVSQWMPDVITGAVQLGFASVTSALPMMKDGKVKVLGVTGAKRNELLPHVPTFGEQGVAGFDAGGWIGLFGPGRLPPATVEALHADVMKVMARPDVKATLAAQGVETGGEAPAAFARRVAAELAENGELAGRLGLKAE